MWVRGIVLAAAVGAFLAAGAHGRPVQVQVDAGRTYQTIEGFGTMWIEWQDRPEYHDPTMFDLAVNDLGMSILRMWPPPEMEVVNDDDDPNHFRWEGFNMDMLNQRMSFALEFRRRGVDRFVGSFLSPPEFMKTHRATDYGGFLRADMYDEYAEYVAAFVLAAKKNWDIDIYAVTLQNELLFVEFYGSCVYNPQAIREAVRAVMRKFKREGISTLIMMPEDMMFLDRMLAYIGPTMADPETRNFPGHFCTHRQGGYDVVRQWYERTAQYGRQSWMTETGGHPNNWQGAVRMACDMYDYLVGGRFSAWIYERLSADPNAVSALFVNGRPGPKYYAAKHFFRFVRPGAQMVDARSSDGDLLASAFRHAEHGTLAVVLINRDRERPAEVSVALGGSGVPQSYEVYLSTEQQGCVLTGTVTGPAPTVVMPPMSIVTLFGGRQGGPPMPKPVEVRLPAPAERVGDFRPPEMGRGYGLFFAAARGGPDWLSRELGRGIDVNTPRYGGWTALHGALLAGKEDNVRLLLERGADVNRAADDGWTPLHMAASCFTDAKYRVFTMIMDRKPDVNARTKDGWTPLHAAAANAHTAWRQNQEDALNRLRDLVRAGADIQARDVKGRTPLHWAAMQGHSANLLVNGAVAQTLCELGADVNAVDDLGRTPLHYAAEMGFDRIVEVLLRAGARTDVRDKAGQTPADLAAARALTSTLELLRGGGRPGPAPAEQPRPAAGRLGPELLRAARNGELERVRQLLAQGADIFYMDSDGFRAVDRARDNGHDEIVRLLQEAERRQGQPPAP